MFILPETVPSLLPGPISILELRKVNTEFLPPVLVKLTSMEELERRKEEIDNEHPHLAEETAWVLLDERRRRRKARQIKLRII
ncbi:hypothetical protein [Hymenobacter sp. YC55]|uniref:hypothetical protein n=1 Tax=Hymenobacter sp. YC55 TaxID=3034019 RepID=UPI0023F7E4C6|nr:hypothetical protein [Hymenobacter sp. YC55]